ncbi:CGNR zinc finger domain-containing protein [Streptomyces sp. NBC_00444]|uniref:CGNR zinc finger domain-containing protein n=1 Tax=unclassified Streptomyces TaxID=2593676 RepID=UPI003FA69A91
MGERIRRSPRATAHPRHRRSAADRTTAERGELHPDVRPRRHGADRCALRFLDRSPARTRRWCAMSRCGNRTKVRLRQTRARQSGGITAS